MMSTKNRRDLGSLRGGIAVFLGALFWLMPESASADASSCVSFHASGQRSMKTGALRQAAKDFTACGSDETCPPAIRNECVELYASVEHTLPTVIFSIVDEQGRDVTAVKVFSGDELLIQSLDGRALPIDPGKYHFRIELPWGETTTQDVLIREGEKSRLVSLKVRDPSQVLPAVSPAAVDPGLLASAPVTLQATPNRTPAAFWVMASLGVAAIGTGVVFELLGYGKHSDLADCSPGCPESSRDDYDAAKRNYLIGDIALGVGLASAGVAAVIYLTSSPRKQESGTVLRAPRFSIVPTASSPGATLQFAGATF